MAALSTAVVIALATTAVVLVGGQDAPTPPAPTTSSPPRDDLVPRIEAGAPALGSDMSEPAPDAIYVDPEAPDGGDGNIARPVPSVKAALDRVNAGPREIVLRAGVYREEVFIGRSKTVTIRAYPGEEVWFDGTDPLGGWSADGEVWSAAWDKEFSSSPTYQGGEDSTEENWQFVDPEHPFAAYPEQVWFDGVALEQVAPDAVKPGTFALAADGSHILIGEDPDGHEVLASTRQRAFQVRSDDSVLRGFGVRRYAPSVALLGSVVLEGNRDVVDGLVIEDSSTSGLFVTGTGSTVRDTTLRRGGLIGATANFADDLTLQGLLFEQNNAELFNQAPVSGGFKISRSRHLTILDSVFLQNQGPGIWLDQSVFDTTIARTDVLGNAGHGVFAEISDQVRLVDLLIAGNGRIGLKINDTSNVAVWRSTIIGNGLGVSILQDTRRASDPSIPGHDERRPIPDPGMTWVVSGVEIVDSVIGELTGSERDQGSQAAVPLWVQDYSSEFDAEAMGVELRGSVLYQNDPDAPLAYWQSTPTTVDSFFDLEDWWTVTDHVDVAAVDETPIGADHRLTDAAREASPEQSTPPAEIAALLPADAEPGPGAIIP
ncbi:right-handed parallel beta-helix repeat-containing protein [Homoserinibacter sp. GY 40078]|uniref:right-handed parallel beta-helix repeat-containing protein n=1 Tax=Homoserinibacter sp. GY 40078 TaxID=2603275 RepID=UPI0011C9C3D4|nr:right-handed parallel beta-helix repeat-containing protein [Homoserinibacter sp. GY 40078]TXK17736.1 hypothetical protein FVQ89_13135 [Homoserinibacter sp. GY 40078]